MKCQLQNSMRRPVSFIGNTGRAYHLPPKFNIEMPMLEIKGNRFVDKLVAKGILKLTPEAK